MRRVCRTMQVHSLGREIARYAAGVMLGGTSATFPVSRAAGMRGARIQSRALQWRRRVRTVRIGHTYMTGTYNVFSIDISAGFDDDIDAISMAILRGLHKGGVAILHSYDMIRGGEVV